MPVEAPRSSYRSVGSVYRTFGTKRPSELDDGSVRHSEGVDEFRSELLHIQGVVVAAGCHQFIV